MFHLSPIGMGSRLKLRRRLQLSGVGGREEKKLIIRNYKLSTKSLCIQLFKS